MKNAPAYSRVVAGSLAHQWRNKRLFGKPYLKVFECLALSAYLFKVGGLLAARYAGKLDAFGPAFLGMSGPPGAMKTFCTGVANKLFAENRVNESTTSSDFVQAELAARWKYEGDAAHFHTVYATEQIPLDIAAEFAWQCAARGVAVAAIHPTLFRSMFERSYAPIPKEKWQRAYAAGLDIGPEQPRWSYQEAEEAEDKAFMEYCREYRPDLYAVLTTS